MTESFMDELAAAARQEPVAYRLALLPAVTNAIFAATGKRLRKLSVDTLIGGDMRGGD